MNKGHLLLMLMLPLIAIAFRIAMFTKGEGKLRASLKSCAVDQLKAVALYGLLGPPLGVLPLVLVGVYLKGEFHHVWIVVPAMVFSFPFGALPAMATGAVIGALKPWLWGWPALAAGGVFGMVLTAQWLAALSLANEAKNVAIFALAGGFAGAACARVLFRTPGKAV
jgi:hypothetical protein